MKVQPVKSCLFGGEIVFLVSVSLSIRSLVWVMRIVRCIEREAESDVTITSSAVISRDLTRGNVKSRQGL